MNFPREAWENYYDHRTQVCLDEAVEIIVGENISMNIRMVDCVGYTVEGAAGYEDEEGPRMVSTPGLITISPSRRRPRRAPAR